jgi:hypothetical protein
MLSEARKHQIKKQNHKECLINDILTIPCRQISAITAKLTDPDSLFGIWFLNVEMHRLNRNRG